MKRELAKDLKLAGFPVGAYRSGHKFYPLEDDSGWTEAARQNGIIISAYDIESRLQDLRNGYYCPNLSDLIDACGKHFARVYPLKAMWIAESASGERAAMGQTPEEAVAELWLALNKVKAPDGNHRG